MSGPPEETLAASVSGTDPTLAASGDPAADAGAVEALRAGERVGHFAIVDVIGRGGMGIVYLAEDSDLGRRVALKLLHAESRDQERLQREARALASLSHPHVVVVYEVGEHKGRVFVAMEHVDGETLRAWIDAHGGAVADVLDMFRRVGEGLAAAHAAGIVHRDFKPDNVIVGREGRPRILDFGLAGASVAASTTVASGAAAIDLTATGAVMGTPKYMAPEQHLGVRVDARADQFAFCVALCEALFGASPFAGETYPDLRAAVLQGELRMPVSTAVPASVRAAIQKGLALDPNDRHASMSALLHELDRDRAEPRRRAGIVVAGAVAAAAVVGIGIAMSQRDGDERAPVAEASAPAVAVKSDGSVAVEQLTHTSGYGVHLLTVGRGGRELVYAVERELWRRDLEGGRASLLEFDVGDYPLIAFAEGDAMWAWGSERLSRVTLDGDATVIAEGVGLPLGLRASPRGDLLATWHDRAITLWSVGSTPATAREIAVDVEVQRLVWSPDGHRLAVTSADEQRQNGSDVWLVDVGSGAVRALELEGNPEHGPLWIDDQTLLMPDAVAMGGHRLQCVAIDDHGARSIGFSEPVRQGSVLELIEVLDEGRVLAQIGDVSKGVAVLDRAQPKMLHTSTAEMRALEHSPVWHDDDELYFVTDRHKLPLVARARFDAIDETTPEIDGPIAWITPDGAGGLVLRREPAGALLHLAPGAAQPRPISQAPVDSPWPEDLRCVAPDRCIGLVRDPLAFVRMDLATGIIAPAMPCPEAHTCAPERFGVSKDGQRLAILRADLRGATVYGLDGEVQWRSPEVEDGIALTSVGFAASPAELLFTALGGRGYALLELDRDGTWRELWTDPRTFLQDPRLSPSGQRIAATAVTYHLEAARIDLRGFCRPTDG